MLGTVNSYSHKVQSLHVHKFFQHVKKIILRRYILNAKQYYYIHTQVYYLKIQNILPIYYFTADNLTLLNTLPIYITYIISYEYEFKSTYRT